MIKPKEIFSTEVSLEYLVDYFKSKASPRIKRVLENRNIELKLCQEVIVSGPNQVEQRVCIKFNSKTNLDYLSGERGSTQERFFRHLKEQLPGQWHEAYQK